MGLFPSPARCRGELSFLLFWISGGRFHGVQSAYRLFENSLRQHRYGRADLIMRLAARRHPQSSDLESMQCTLAFKNGDIEGGFSRLSRRLAEGDFRAVERLLFRTGSRPASSASRLEVFDRIADHPQVLASHRCYARIAQTYLVLRLEDQQRAADLLPALRDLALELTADPALGRCLEPNRRNQAKMFVSLCTATYHLGLLLDDDAPLLWAWELMLNVLPRFAFDKMNADAALRMSSNLCRCLACGVLLSDSLAIQAPERSAQALHQVKHEVLSHCCSGERNGKQKTQENHIALIDNLSAAIDSLQTSEGQLTPKAMRQLARLLNHASSSALVLSIEKRLATQADR